MIEFIKKNKILVGIEIIVCLCLLLAGLFMKEEQIVYLTTEDWKQVFSESTAQIPVGDLSLGTYEVRVEMDGLGSTATLLLDCEKNTFRALRTNAINLYANNPYMDYEAYVLGTVENASLVLNIAEEQLPHIKTVALYKTGKAFGMLLFCTLCVSLAVNALLWFKGSIAKGKYTTKQQMVFWGICSAVVVSCIPLAIDYFSIVCDLPFHLTRIEGLKESLLNGVFPVRVQEYWLYDHGYAVSLFYGDLFLIFPAILRIIGFSSMTAYKLFVAFVMIATAGICYYSIKKCTKDIDAAFVGTVLYVLSPYRIYNVYCRGAVGEYLAMMLFPLVICGIYQLLQSDTATETYKKAKWPLIWGLSGILNSHMLSCELTIIILLVISIVYWKKVFRKDTMLQLLQAAGICLFINCWYWLPFLWMFTTDSYVLSNIVSKSIQYMGTWFATAVQLTPYKGAAQTGMYNCEPIHLGIAAVVLLLIFIFLIFVGGSQKRNERKVMAWKSMKFFAVCTAVFVILSSRYITLATVFCAFFSGFFVCWLKQIPNDFVTCFNATVKKITIAVVVVIAFGAAVFQTGEICIYNPVMRVYSAENMGTTSVVAGEYLLAGTSLSDYEYHKPVAEEGLTYSEYEKQGTDISFILHNTSQEEKHIELPLTGYKGYRITNKEASGMVHITEERGDHGDLRLNVPAGFQGEVQISYTGPIWFKLAECISCISIAVLVAWIFIKKKKGGKS